MPWVAVHGDTSGNVAVLREGGSGLGGSDGRAVPRDSDRGWQCPGKLAVAMGTVKGWWQLAGKVTVAMGTVTRVAVTREGGSALRSVPWRWQCQRQK